MTANRLSSIKRNSHVVLSGNRFGKRSNYDMGIRHIKRGIILDFYRQMVRNYAEWGLPLPDEIECESNLNAAYREGFLKSGNMFQNVRIEANSARSKRCEGTGGRFVTRWKRSIRMDRPSFRSERVQSGRNKGKRDSAV